MMRDTRTDSQSGHLSPPESKNPSAQSAASASARTASACAVWEGRGMPMVVVEMHCTCGAHERVVTSEFALPMRRAQLRRDHEGDGHDVYFDEHDWQPGEPY